MNGMTRRSGDYRFVSGLFAGAFVGAGLAMWLAPRASEKFQQASTRVGKTIGDLTEKAREVRNDIGGAVERVATSATSLRVVEARPPAETSTP